MKVNLPQSAVDILKEIIEENGNRSNTVRIYFAGLSCSGPVFKVALDGKSESDVEYDISGINFVMDKEDYEKYGDVNIVEEEYGYIISVENMPKGTGGCEGCSGCN
ncbi:MAG: Fe-S cluster assembly protein HesB [Romboutsia sp.]